jgi:L-threonylcarbamoyladenylate synthase
LQPGDFRVQVAASIVAQEGVIAYPTEAVWGLGCDPFCESAVRRVLALKQRPENKGLILVAASVKQFSWLIHDLPNQYLALLSSSWPGPTTWLVPHRGRVPSWICGEHNTVALRVSAHPVVQALCSAFGAPLVSTSANQAGKSEARYRFQVYRQFRGQLDYVAPGLVGGNRRASEIRDVVTNEVLRSG